MPGLSLKCLFLIKGSGMICLDRPDCTTAERQQQTIMWLDSTDPALSQSRAVRAWPRTAQQLNTRAAPSYIYSLALCPHLLIQSCSPEPPLLSSKGRGL